MKQFLTIFGFSLLSRVTARCQHGYGCGDDGECIDGYQLDIMFETTCQVCIYKKKSVHNKMLFMHFCI